MKKKNLPERPKTGTKPDRKYEARASRSLSRILPCLLPPFILLIVALSAFFAWKKEADRIASIDTTPPRITLTRDPEYYVMPGEEYREEGYLAIDAVDGDLTGQVERTVEDGVVCYRVLDQAGNMAVRYRDIPYKYPEYAALSRRWTADNAQSAQDAGVDTLEAEAAGKVIYLTFDDGPGEYTEKLLGILDRYNVKATFFVTGAFPSYASLVAREYEAGHSIGVHTFSHDFAKIYADEDAFWADFEKIQKVVEEQTGHRTVLMRFAGGSSNTVTGDSPTGIMKKLTEEAEARGYHYFDWNVSSGDGAASGSSEMVISNITSRVENNDVSVVLCHDTKEYTVNAMEYIIPWALENGYTLLPLSPVSETAHHVLPD